MLAPRGPVLLGGCEALGPKMPWIKIDVPYPKPGSLVSVTQTMDRSTNVPPSDLAALHSKGEN